MDSYIKRVIALPNENIKHEDNKLNNNIEVEGEISIGFTWNFIFIDGKDGFIPKDCYFVLGDNREDSIDSRGLGYIKKDEIVGKGFNSFIRF